jgi:hypothetical protein
MSTAPAAHEKFFVITRIAKPGGNKEKKMERPDIFS